MDSDIEPNPRTKGMSQADVTINGIIAQKDEAQPKQLSKWAEQTSNAQNEGSKREENSKKSIQHQKRGPVSKSTQK